MKRVLILTVVLLSLCCLLSPGILVAGLDEGLIAYKEGDFDTALKEFLPIAENGDAKAQVNLGSMYATGNGVTKDSNEAMKWYRLAANQGVAAAQFNLGLMYDNGQGVSNDDKEAIKWYRLAADQGFQMAQYNLAEKYRKGQGVEMDANKALNLYRLAAKSGHARSQFYLGANYIKVQNYKEAIKWYRLAAEQGISQAQSNLAVMYNNGDGVKSSKIVAYSLLKISGSDLSQLVNLMSEKEIEDSLSLSHEMSKPGNLLKALDAYVEKISKPKNGKPNMK